MRVSKWLTAAVASAACLALSACGVSGGPTEDSGSGTTVRVAGNSNATMLPLWVGMEKGMFADKGLTVSLKTIENIATLVPALGKSFDIVLSTPTLVIASNAQGIPVQWVSGSSVDSVQRTSGELLAMGNSGIDDVADLQGKSIGVLNESGTLHSATAYWLKQEGVDLESVEIVQVDGPAQADQLKSGRIDAVESVTPFTGQIKAVGGESLGVPYRSLANTIAPIMFAAKTQWAQQNPETVEKFQQVLEQGAEYIASHEQEARDILQEKTGYPDAVVQSIVFPQYDTSVRTQDLQTWYKAMHEVTGFTTDLKVDKLAFQGGEQ
jgi:NitT/TauT family transport system substrate-binding protein